MGTYIFNDGSIYKGQFKNNIFEGEGELLNKFGDKSVGIFKDGLLNGKGFKQKQNGDKLEGEWKNGQFNGIWIYYCKNNNTTKKILYENNKFLKYIE